MELALISLNEVYLILAVAGSGIHPSLNAKDIS